MFGSSIIDIAIGMIFVYLLLSLVCSAANELIERYSRKRGHDLEKGIVEMLRSPDLVKSLYEHPIVYSLFAKPYHAGGKNLPSYIPARNFALALMDIAAPGGATGAMALTSTSPVPVDFEKLKADISNNTILPPQIRQALTTFIDASGNNTARVRENIENWFDSSMDRVSGTYKRRSQLIVLLIGLALSILLNVDSIALVRTLSTDRAMRDSLVAAAQEYAKSVPGSTPTPSPAASAVSSPQPQNSPSPSATPKSCGMDETPECRVKKNLEEIKKLGLPIGWTREISEPADPRQFFGITPQGWTLRVVGWLLTALAISLGAPFWFDLLNKFIVVRSTVKPKEKSPEEKSKD